MMPIRHNIPGARKRRVERHGPREPTGWVFRGDETGRNRHSWEHPDGRSFEWSSWSAGWQSPDNLYADMTQHLGKGASHPGRFREQLPF